MNSDPARPVTLPQQQCRMTRSELQRLLADSGYGANTFMFNCYFVPETQPPLCSVCNRAIGEHDDMQQPQPFMGTAIPPPTAQAYFGTGITTTLLIAGDGGGEDMGPPENLVVGIDGIDSVIKGYGCSMIFMGVLFFIICAGLLIGFGASGLLVQSPIVCIGPSITGVMGVLLIVINNRSWILFDRNQREVRFGTQYLLGCGSSGKCDFSQIGEVTESLTNVRVNKQPQFKIDIQLGDKEVTVQKYLSFQMAFGGNAKVARWKNYINALKTGQQSPSPNLGVVDRF